MEKETTADNGEAWMRVLELWSLHLSETGSARFSAGKLFLILSLSGIKNFGNYSALPRLSKFTGFLLNISPAIWIYYCNKVSIIQILMAISYIPKSGALKSNKSVYFDSLAPPP